MRTGGTTDPRLYASATERNRDPILGVLAALLAPGARVLEIASGTGEHAIHFATALPGVVWQPTDPDPAALASIAAHAEAAEAHGRVAGSALLAPRKLDVTTPADWPAGPFDAVFVSNLTHIAPWPVTPALLAGAARVLPAGGLLMVYGPFIRPGVETAPSNLAFDDSLRAQNPAWGLRDLAAVTEAAAAAGLAHRETRALPANNVIVVYVRV